MGQNENITNNGADGIYLALGSKLFVGGGPSGGISITGNAGPGVTVNDVSIAFFAENSQVTNIVCTAPTAITEHAILVTHGNTNCSN